MDFFGDELCYFIYNDKNHISFIGCKKCGWSINHNNIEEEEKIQTQDDKYESSYQFSKQHFTCICKLFESSIICCDRGYENLLLAIPSIAFHSPNPMGSTENTFIDFGNVDLAISISRKEFRRLYEITNKIKLKAICEYLLKQKFFNINFIN